MIHDAIKFKLENLVDQIEKIFLKQIYRDRKDYYSFICKVCISAYNSYGETLFENMIRMLPANSNGDGYMTETVFWPSFYFVNEFGAMQKKYSFVLLKFND